jgi:ATP-dependent RNA helicase DDX1
MASQKSMNLECLLVGYTVSLNLTYWTCCVPIPTYIYCGVRVKVVSKYLQEMAGGFESVGLMPELIKSTTELEWHLPTDVQDEAIPLILGGGDVMAAAETGSGKTGAFCLPIIQVVHERLRDSSGGGRSRNRNSSSSASSPAAIQVHHVTINENDKDSLMEIGAGGLSCSSSAEKLWVGARATHGVNKGVYYYEATVTGTGLCRLGWSTMAAHLEIGKDVHGYGYGGTGMKSFGGQFTEYGGKFGKGDVVGCLVDWNKKEISYSVNGVDKGVAFTIGETIAGAVLFPAVLLKGSSVILNFGESPFKHQPAIAVGLCHAKAEHIVSYNAREAFQVVGKRSPMALILEPARDLAEQVFNSIEDLSKYVQAPSIKSLLLVGGDESRKLEKVINSGVDIVVGTLGKVSDMVKNRGLDLSQVRFFVLDEADRLTDPENMQQIMHLYGQCPGGGSGDNRLQVCFFSATLHSPAIKDLAAKICVNPTWVDLKGVDSVPETVHHVICIADPEVNSDLLVTSTTPSITDGVYEPSNKNIKDITSEGVKAIKQQMLIKIIDKFQMSQCMIFCRTNLDCDNLESFLCLRGGGSKFRERKESGKEHEYSCAVLGGMRSMEERRRNLEAFRAGDVRFLLCTDVAARGIDIQGLPYVINMTLPDEPEHYIHRIGRVGRADRMGLAISIVAAEGVEERVWYHSNCSNRGKGCYNRNLVEKGGCTIWYNEPRILAAVKERLHMTQIPSLTESYELPPELACFNVTYGEEANMVTDTTQSAHIQSIGSTVKELGEMEVESQNIFLRLKTEYAASTSLQRHQSQNTAAAGASNGSKKSNKNVSKR